MNEKQRDLAKKLRKYGILIARGGIWETPHEALQWEILGKYLCVASSTDQRSTHWKKIMQNLFNC